MAIELLGDKRWRCLIDGPRSIVGKVPQAKRQIPEKTADPFSNVPRQEVSNKVTIGRMPLPFVSASESTSQRRADYDRIVLLANRVVSLIRPWQPWDKAVP